MAAFRLLRAHIGEIEIRWGICTTKKKKKTGSRLTSATNENHHQVVGIMAARCLRRQAHALSRKYVENELGQTSTSSELHRWSACSAFVPEAWFRVSESVDHILVTVCSHHAGSGAVPRLLQIFCKVATDIGKAPFLANCYSTGCRNSQSFATTLRGWSKLTFQTRALDMSDGV